MVTRDDRGLEVVTRGDKELKGDYEGKEGVTRGCNWLQGVTKRYRW